MAASCMIVSGHCAELGYQETSQGEIGLGTVGYDLFGAE